MKKRERGDSHLDCGQLISNTLAPENAYQCYILVTTWISLSKSWGIPKDRRLTLIQSKGRPLTALVGRYRSAANAMIIGLNGISFPHRASKSLAG
jgi:hypothetical protein